MRLFNKIYYTSLAAFFASADTVFADSGSAISQNLENPLGSTTTIYVFLEKVLAVVAQIGFPVVVLAIVYSGFLYVKAQGDPGGLEEAKTALTWSIVGGAIILGAWVIAEAIGGTISTLR
ncbi:pilin [Patescibacteria group bacterium]